jgi:hypothetical protein
VHYAHHLPLPVPGMKAMVEYHAFPEGVSRWRRFADHVDYKLNLFFKIVAQA